MSKSINLIVFDLDDTLICTRTKLFLYDVENLLIRLKNDGFKIALASYNPYADDVLKTKRLYHYFDFVEYEDWRFQDELDMKENMLRTILKKSNVEAQNILFIDDQIRFVEKAKMLGLKTHVYRYGMDMNQILPELIKS